jgi:hypothetical protein
MLPSPIPTVDGDKIYIDYDPLAKGTVGVWLTVHYGKRCDILLHRICEAMGIRD